MNDLKTEVELKIGIATIRIQGELSSIENQIEEIKKLILKINDVFTPEIQLRHTSEKGTIPGPSSGPLHLPEVSPSAGLREAIRSVLSSDWGKITPRTKSEIAEILKLSAIHYPDSTIRSTLSQLTRKGELRRVRRDGIYAYIVK